MTSDEDKVREWVKYDSLPACGEEQRIDGLLVLEVMEGVLAALDEARRERDEARASVEHMRAREEHFARVLQVTDGGTYRHDWTSAIERLMRERDEARAELETARQHHAAHLAIAREAVPDEAAERLRATAIEECARVCDEEAAEWWRMGDGVRRDAAARVAFRLRALLASEPGA